MYVNNAPRPSQVAHMLRTAAHPVISALRVQSWHFQIHGGKREGLGFSSHVWPEAR